MSSTLTRALTRVVHAQESAALAPEGVSLSEVYVNPNDRPQPGAPHMVLWVGAGIGELAAA